MKLLNELLLMLDPASQGNAYQKMPKERMLKLASFFTLKPRDRWAFRRY